MDLLSTVCYVLSISRDTYSHMIFINQSEDSDLLLSHDLVTMMMCKWRHIERKCGIFFILVHFTTLGTQISVITWYLWHREGKICGQWLKRQFAIQHYGNCEHYACCILSLHDDCYYFCCHSPLECGQWVEGVHRPSLPYFLGLA